MIEGIHSKRHSKTAALGEARQALPPGRKNGDHGGIKPALAVQQTNSVRSEQCRAEGSGGSLQAFLQQTPTGGLAKAAGNCDKKPDLPRDGTLDHFDERGPR